MGSLLSLPILRSIDLKSCTSAVNVILLRMMWINFLQQKGVFLTKTSSRYSISWTCWIRRLRWAFLYNFLKMDNKENRNQIHIKMKPYFYIPECHWQLDRTVNSWWSWTPIKWKEELKSEPFPIKQFSQP